MAIRYSVAEARNEFAEIINRVAYSGEIVTVEKHGTPIVKIVPVAPKIDEKVIDKYFGMWKNKKWAKDVGKPSRFFGRRDI